ncbi:adenylate/guanylate cyclase domain-containing protein [Aquibium carbonis]|uniref:Adenylate/guanylate cyclase domain-containing protein n=1 Tax=Aquibium carbonis TaxID=2495581 RepID=A0A3S0AVB0_9HYPH|nr:adenylate/guanylate cyclase domain-containing protein [Aquibium carbonis]RST87972.1 adenylate/guanylate cyclase domain-containing protein [Aquibium carbonis]
MALVDRVGTAIAGRRMRRRVNFPKLLDETFSSHEREGRKLQFRGRSLSLLVALALTHFIVPYPEAFFYQGVMLLFVFTGFIPTWFDKRGWLREWHPYLFVTIDFVALTFFIVSPNPLAPADLPPQIMLHFDTSLYLFLLLSSLAFADSPRLVIWGGIAGGVSWMLGVFWLASLPDSVVIWPGYSGIDLNDVRTRMRLIGTPTTVDLSVQLQTVVLFFVVSVVLAAGVARSRRLVWRYAVIERQRLNLARYFPPATVDQLAREDEPLQHIREVKAAILFADLVGFARWSERHTPAQTIAMLREVHGLLEEAVFHHGGTLDKFIGDGVMATFGTPEPLSRDAVNAFQCVTAILKDFSELNDRRIARGEEMIQIAVGAHFGSVVVGNIGTERRLELGVIGDTVNVASRLEELTRHIGRAAVISDDLVQDMRREDPEAAEGLLAGFENLGGNQLDGRRQDVVVWASTQTLSAADSRSRWARAS